VKTSAAEARALRRLIDREPRDRGETRSIARSKRLKAADR
jgi:hypothetical protein